jgi:hypothetical protein
MLASSIWWIAVISGVATAVAGLAAFAVPTVALRACFGIERIDAPLRFFTRHWGLLIFLFGALVFCSAYAPELRRPVLLAAAIGKFVIVALIFFGPLKRTVPMTAIAAGDGTFAVLYLVYLFGG